MPNFAVYSGDTIVNVVVAESAELAEEVTGLSAVETTGEPWIGWTKHDGAWRPPSPFPSWVWNGTAWEAPVPMPSESGPWMWDETSQSWVPE